MEHLLVPLAGFGSVVSLALVAYLLALLSKPARKTHKRKYVVTGYVPAEVIDEAFLANRLKDWGSYNPKRYQKTTVYDTPR
jgi:hypothetical protein